MAQVARLALGAVMVVIAAAGKAEVAALQAANTGVSVMLLGSIGFMMGLFYLVNQKDDEMRKYSWMVISSTISIFSSVLLFQAWNGVVESYVLGEHASESKEVLVSMVHFVFWFLILQALLGLLAGTRSKEAGSEEAEEEADASRELNLKSGGVLLGHIAGFAAINAFATLQVKMLPHTFLVSVLCAPLAWIFIFFLSKITRTIRFKVAMSDGTMDERERTWNDEAAETENDITGLAVSFMVVQALRLCIGGTLPNTEGEEPRAVLSHHSDSQAIFLCLAGLFFVILEVIRIIEFPHLSERMSERVVSQFKNIIAMDFSWCVFFSSEWFVASHFFISVGGMMQEITVALFVTFAALLLIFILDKVEDMESTNRAVDSACVAVIKAISVLIGFSWEKAFDTAVADFTEAITFLPSPITKLILAMLLATLVIPAWRLHILPCVMAFEEEEAEEEEAAAQESSAREIALTPEGGDMSPESSLSKPLLAQVKRKSRGCIGQDLPTLQRNNKEYKAKIRSLEKTVALGSAARNAELERRNSELQRRTMELEALLANVSGELSEMQRLADDLAR